MHLYIYGISTYAMLFPAEATSLEVRLSIGIQQNQKMRGISHKWIYRKCHKVSSQEGQHDQRPVYRLVAAANSEFNKTDGRAFK